MNLLMVSGVLLFAMLAFQPTLIYGKRSTPNTDNEHSHSHRKRSPAANFPAAELIMPLESGDVLVRSARGANIGDAAPAVVATPVEASVDAPAATAVGHGKRMKTASGTNRKLSKHAQSSASAPAATANANATPNPNAGRKHGEKKFSASIGQQQQQQQQQHLAHHQRQQQKQQKHGGNRGKQRQLVKSQQHQNHNNKRSGGKTRTNENGEKSVKVEKSQSTCRYAKSAWTDCDAKTNMRTRTLTLKKGEANCAPTRTMQKKCKKSCRYEKGLWSACSNGQMTRQDKLKSTGDTAAGDSSCEAVRTIAKKCKEQQSGAGGSGKSNKERKNKDKASRRVSQQA